MRKVVYKFDEENVIAELIYQIKECADEDWGITAEDKNGNIIDHNTSEEDIEEFLRHDEKGWELVSEEYYDRLMIETNRLDDYEFNDLLEENFGEDSHLFINYNDDRYSCSRGLEYDYPPIKYSDLLERLSKHGVDYSYDQITIECYKNADMLITLDESCGYHHHEILIINSDLKTNPGYDIGDIIEIVNDTYYPNDFTDDDFFDELLMPYLEDNNYFDSVSRYIAWWLYDVNKEWELVNKMFTIPHQYYYRNLFNIDYFITTALPYEYIELKNMSFEDMYGAELKYIPESYGYFADRFKLAYELYKKLALIFINKVSEIDTYNWAEPGYVLDAFSNYVESKGEH